MGDAVGGGEADAVARLLAGRLGWRELAAGAGVRRAWAHEFAQDDLWARHLSEVYPQPPAPASESQAEAEGPEVPRRAFAEAHRKYGAHGDLYARVSRSWGRLEAFLQRERRAGSQGAEAIWRSLRPGLRDAEINYAQELLGLELPPALCMMLRWHDGQKLQTRWLGSPNLDDEVTGLLTSGCLGSYSVYGHDVSLHLLSLSQVVLLTEKMRPRIPGHYVVFAASWGMAKILLLDCRDSSVSFVTHHSGSLVPVVERSDVPGKFGLAEWFEQYTCALASGELGMEASGRRPMEPEEASLSRPLGISLFPRNGVTTSRAVTRGVEVCASALVVPELLLEEGGNRAWTIAYSIRFRLLPEADQVAEGGGARAMKRCQLRTRHWVMRDRHLEVTQRVSGEAVVGDYPILQAGGESFVYQSCTRDKDLGNHMEGTFNFVEGTIAQPEGPGFDVICARFCLDRCGRALL